MVSFHLHRYNVTYVIMYIVEPPIVAHQIAADANISSSFTIRDVMQHSSATQVVYNVISSYGQLSTVEFTWKLPVKRAKQRQNNPRSIVFISAAGEASFKNLFSVLIMYIWMVYDTIVHIVHVHMYIIIQYSDPIYKSKNECYCVGVSTLF